MGETGLPETAFRLWQIRTNSSTLWGLKDEEFKGFAVIAGGVRLSNGRHFVQPIALFIADVLSRL